MQATPRASIPKSILLIDGRAGRAKVDEVARYKAKSELIAFALVSLFFKTFQIHRAVDAKKNVLVYTVVSTKLINASPFNSISVVPVEAR